MITKFNIFERQKPKIEYYPNGQKWYERWVLNGKRHREDGPAVQRWHNVNGHNNQKWYEIWYLNDKRHREDGPAVQYWNKEGIKVKEKWYLNDKNYTRRDWIKELWKIKPEEARRQQELIEIDDFKI